MPVGAVRERRTESDDGWGAPCVSRGSRGRHAPWQAKDITTASGSEMEDVRSDREQWSGATLFTGRLLASRVMTGVMWSETTCEAGSGARLPNPVLTLCGRGAP